MYFDDNAQLPDNLESDQPNWELELRHQQEKLFAVAREACEALSLFAWLSMGAEARDAFMTLAKQIQHVQVIYGYMLANREATS